MFDSSFNQTPMNQAALEFLAPDWIDHAHPHVLSLAIWGMEEHNLQYYVAGRDFHEALALELRVLGLVKCSPETVEAFLPVNPVFLEDRESPEEAAFAILEAAYGRLSDPEGYR